MLRESSLRTGVQLASLLKTENSKIVSQSPSILDDIVRAIRPLLINTSVEADNLVDAITKGDEGEIDRIIAFISSQSDTKDMGLFNNLEPHLMEAGMMIGRRIAENIEFAKKILVPIILKFNDKLAGALNEVGSHASDYLDIVLVDSPASEYSSDDFEPVWDIRDPSHILDVASLEVLRAVTQSEAFKTEVAHHPQLANFSVEEVITILPEVHTAVDEADHYLYLSVLGRAIAVDPYLDNGISSEENNAFGTSLYATAVFNLCRVIEDNAGSDSIISIFNPQYPDLVFRPSVTKRQTIYVNADRVNALDFNHEGFEGREKLCLTIIGYLLTDYRPYNLTPSTLNDPEAIRGYMNIAQEKLKDIAGDRMSKIRVLQDTVRNGLREIYSEHEEEIMIFNPTYKIDCDYSTGLEEIFYNKDNIVFNEEWLLQLAIRLVGERMFGDFEVDSLLQDFINNDPNTTPSYIATKYAVKTVTHLLSMMSHTTVAEGEVVVASGGF